MRKDHAFDRSSLGPRKMKQFENFRNFPESHFAGAPSFIYIYIGDCDVSVITLISSFRIREYLANGQIIIDKSLYNPRGKGGGRGGGGGGSNILLLTVYTTDLQLFHNLVTSQTIECVCIP